MSSTMTSFFWFALRSSPDKLSQNYPQMDGTAYPLKDGSIYLEIVHDTQARHCLKTLTTISGNFEVQSWSMIEGILRYAENAEAAIE